MIIQTLRHCISSCYHGTLRDVTKKLPGVFHPLYGLQQELFRLFLKLFRTQQLSLEPTIQIPLPWRHIYTEPTAEGVATTGMTMTAR